MENSFHSYEMTGNSMNTDFTNSSKPVRKRIRDNHNELERVRRNNQKAQLDTLRLALPFQDMDDKASMVSIFIRAREYIGMLEQRIIELQGGGTPVQSMEYPGQTVLPTPSPSISSRSPKLPSFLNPQYEMPQFKGRERELSVNSDNVQVHHGISFFNPGFLASSNSSSNLEPTSSLGSPTGSIASQRPSSPLNNDMLLNADFLLNFVSDNFIKHGRAQRLSSDEEKDFMRTFDKRRASSLLMPFENETVMVQKRDSFSALFSGLFPDIIDSSALINADIKCHNCQKGMCNMIMIDCDRCHKWYHIKCARIDSDSIPTNWNCC